MSKEQVLRAAAGLADRDGFESLTMRTLAHELGAGAMSLYYLVANKNALLVGMVDVVYSEIDPPSSGVDWKTALRGVATLRHHDAVLGRLGEAGFSIEAPSTRSPPSTATSTGSCCRSRPCRSRPPRSWSRWGRACSSGSPPTLPLYLATTVVEFMRSGYRFANEFEVGPS